MKKQKLIKLFAALAMLLPLFFSAFGAGSVVEAQDVGNVNITLHKRGFDKKTPGAKQNDGTSGQPKWDAPVPDNEKLKDVEFMAFDVANVYYDLLNWAKANPATAGDTFKEQQKWVVTQIQEATKGQKADFEFAAPNGFTYDIAKVGNTVKTDDQGMALFENLPEKTTDGKHAVYVFVETGSPYPTLNPETPMVVALPIYYPEDHPNVGQVNKDIHIHPKNDLQDEIGEKEYTGGDAEISVDGYGTVDIGDQLNFQITVPLTDLMNTVTIFDRPTGGLAYVDGSATLNGTPVTVTPEGDGFSLTLDAATLDALRDAGETEIILDYTMEVTEAALPDEAMKNDASISINNGDGYGIGEDPDNPNPEFFTGGKKFIKHDATEKPLAGAEFAFVIVDENNVPTHYLKRDPNTATGDVTWVPVPSQDPADWADAYKVTTPDTGLFEIAGLKYSEEMFNDASAPYPGGSYAVVETMAPDGFVPLDEPHKFDIVKDGYDNPDGIETVKNIPAGFLPETGGMGILAFLLAGLALMMGAVIWYKKSKHDVAEV